MARQRQLKADILTKKAELLQTSAQDQFARWAKLRRSVDKGLAELEKLSCVEFCCHSVPQGRLGPLEDFALPMLTVSRCDVPRWRVEFLEISIRCQVQFSGMDIDDGSAVCGGLVV